MNEPTVDLEAAAGTIQTWLGEADRVLITAGAGLSAAAGYDYGDEDRFRELFPSCTASACAPATSSAYPCLPNCGGATGPSTSTTSASHRTPTPFTSA